MDRRQFVHVTTTAAVAILADRRRLFADAPKPTPGAIVETKAGRVRGLSIDGVQTFKSVPYGASTAGARRFLPPLEVAPWTGVLETFAFGPRAPQVLAPFVPEWQPLTGTEPMSEDCLHLNVWTPQAATGGTRPVMVWLHGGGYTGGSPAALPYDGASLARRHDVVVVSITHRLNVLGFIHLTELGGDRFADASNAGLKDIIAGLTWVRDNIDRFGGDPKNVTIFGQSGGAGKVSTLLGMPAAQGLFHRAIAQSGSAVTSMPAASATQNADALISRLGLKSHQLDELQRLPVEQVLAAMQAPAGSRGFTTSPVVDGRSLPHDVFNPAATPLSASIPLLIGSTETEVTWSVNADYTVPADAAALRDRIMRTLRVDAAKAETLVGVYQHGRPRASLLDLALIMETDASQFRTGVDRQAERKSAAARAPVYMYRFQWYSPVSGGRLRAMHCMDIPFAFDNVDNSQSIVGNGTDRQPLADRMSHAWVAFARTGDPNHAGLPRWEPFTANERATMMLNAECRLARDPYRDERLAMAAATTQG
ncbi:MAG TPA: carboxylesterase/lipase family protein [Vicinamibacterales bacterium]|nr:carboxylesterase/lipase family protein [Vicinamibacterales bacterium]